MRTAEGEGKMLRDDLHKIHIKYDTPESIMIPNGYGREENMETWTREFNFDFNFLPAAHRKLKSLFLKMSQLIDELEAILIFVSASDCPIR